MNIIAKCTCSVLMLIGCRKRAYAKKLVLAIPLVISACGGGSGGSFDDVSEPPEIEIRSVSTLPKNIVLSLGIDPNGDATEYWIEWGTDSSLGNATEIASLGDGTELLGVIEILDGLSPDTTYYYRVIARTEVHAVESAIETFTTLPISLPLVTTNTSTAITANGCTLNGVVNPNKFVSSGWFEWGFGPDYGFSTVPQSLGDGALEVALSQPVTEMNPVTSYHYRAVAENEGGIAYGDDQICLTLVPVPSELDDPTLDSDNDGLNNSDEINIHNTNPRNPDTDGDTLNDGDEVILYSTSPINPDSDGDTLNDAVEINIYSTNPNSTDSDNDGLTDPSEINIHNTAPNTADSDGDLLDDGIEVNTYNTNPLLADTDSDLLNDGSEINTYNTNPLLADTDSDLLSDGAEIFIHNTSPLRSDTDSDGLTDANELITYGTDPLMPDTDGDTLTDSDEIRLHGTDPLKTDTDGDTLLDNDEIYRYCTDPLKTDTDGDGNSDNLEVLVGSNCLGTGNAPPDFLMSTVSGPVAATVSQSIDIYNKVLNQGENQGSLDVGLYLIPERTVFSDDFEDGTVNLLDPDWTALGQGDISIVYDGANQVLRKNTSNSASDGAMAAFSAPVNEYQLTVSSRKVDYTTDNTQRYSVTDASGNGYGVSLDAEGGQLSIARHDNGIPATPITIPLTDPYTLSFDGIDDYVEIPPATDLAGDWAAMTLEAWVKLAAIDNNEHIIFDKTATPGTLFSGSSQPLSDGFSVTQDPSITGTYWANWLKDTDETVTKKITYSYEEPMLYLEGIFPQPSVSAVKNVRLINNADNFNFKVGYLINRRNFEEAQMMLLIRDTDGNKRTAVYRTNDNRLAFASTHIKNSPCTAFENPIDACTLTIAPQHYGTLHLVREGKTLIVYGNDGVTLWRIETGFDFATPQAELLLSMTKLWDTDILVAFDNFVAETSWVAAAPTTSYRLSLKNTVDGYGLRLMGTQGPLDIETNTVIKDYDWHHVIATYDQASGLADFYVDGVKSRRPFAVEDYSGADPIALTIGHPLRIGASNDTPSTVFNGLIDQPAIYTTALTGTDIQARYEGRPKDYCGAHAVGRWGFNKGSGTIVIDHSSNGDNGIITGASWVSGGAPYFFEPGDWYTLRLTRQGLRAVDGGASITADIFPGKHVSDFSLPLATAALANNAHETFSQINISGGAVYDTDDVQVASLDWPTDGVDLNELGARRIVDLSAGTADANSLSVIIPLIPAGDYRIGAYADINDDVSFEISEKNNSRLADTVTRIE